jgi:2-dehydropantoate 2-reductase
VGSVFACLLAEAGHEVTVFGRGDHLRAVAARGLRVGGIWGEHAARGIRAVERAGDLGREYGAVLVTCKSYQTPAILAAIGDRAEPDGLAISLQNGLGNTERIAAVYGNGRVLAGRVIFGAEVTEPGAACVTVEAEPVALGRPGASGPVDDGVRRWAAVFEASGIHCEPTAGIEAVLWAKVFYSAALNPLGALLGLRYGELAANGERRRIMARVVEEAYDVARAEGVALAWRTAAEYLETFFGRLVPATAGHRSSMLQDIEKGRLTEIDAICGEVCRRGDARGIDTPLNRLLAVLVAARTAGAPASRS